MLIELLEYRRLFSAAPSNPDLRPHDVIHFDDAKPGKEVTKSFHAADAHATDGLVTAGRTYVMGPDMVVEETAL